MKSAIPTVVAVLIVAMPISTHAQNPASPLEDRALGAACPLGRVAMVRGSDSEAREGEGFEAARANGIHGAVDLNGSVGDPVFAVANGKATVATRGEWGKLGKTVVLDHLDGGSTIYGHLHTVEVTVNSKITVGQMIGTIGYSGNAAKLRAKDLPPHLHFAYVRGVVPLATIKASSDGVGIDFAKNNVLAGVTGVLHPMWAVRFLKCWESPLPAGAPSLPSTLIMR
jgi:murein DD-endopeptidase MepM/ murein hydrolase activator NlpD